MGALAHYEIARLDRTCNSAARALLSDTMTTDQARVNDNRFRAAVGSFDWGSAETMVGALTALWFEDLTGDRTYRGVALAQRDYLLGVNPWGVSFVNSVGTTWPHHPHHQVADLSGSELVGFWDEGPVTLSSFNEQRITLSATDTFATFQSTESVYHDDKQDYVTNEPTLSMNAVGVALMSWFAPSVAQPTNRARLKDGER